MKPSSLDSQRPRVRLTLFVFVSLIAIAPPCLRAQYKYAIVDLGGFSPVAVNNAGHVAGNGANVGVLYKDGTITVIEAFTATALNNRDEVVGYKRVTSPEGSHAYLYSEQGLVDLWPTTSFIEAKGINDAGSIIGRYAEPSYLSVGLYTKGVLVPVIGFGMGTGINNRDQVVGERFFTPPYGFLYSDGVVHRIDTLLIPHDINDRGEVVGGANTSGGFRTPVAWLYSNGIVTVLSNLPGATQAEAWGINNSGQVVGNSGGRPFLYENGEVVDLNTLVNLGVSDFRSLLTAVAISDTGFIVGSGISKSGLVRAFLLKPQTLPTWWEARGVLDSTKPASDFAAANQGQAKSIASKAYAELQSRLPGGAGGALSAMILSWSSPESASDYAVINQGQLKNIAKLFYDRLAQVGYHGPPLAAGQIYPWTPSTADDADYAAANIGQLKHLFSFDLGGSNTDTDNDGLPDWWENWHFGNITAQTASGDPDGDGSTNLQEYNARTNPNGPNS